MRAKAKAKKRNQKATRGKPEEPEEPEEDLLLIEGDSLGLSDLAKRLGKNPASLIAHFFKQGKCFTVNSILERDLCEEAATEFGVELLFDDGEKESEAANRGILAEEYEDAVPRPPVVTVMGHVDHGKTTLLDTIRKRSVAATEAGGITQRIGAYTVKVGDNKATFIDTPGHEAFTQMRARGAQVTDIAVLVVAADDGVMPQTREAIAHAKAADVPIIVAINKIDKPGANPARARELLAAENVLCEEWGGEVQMVECSAKQNIGIDKLLEEITLTADVGELKARATGPAAGVVLESSFDPGRGSQATVLVQRGTLRVGDSIVSGSTLCRVKALVNEGGGKMTDCGPSTAAQILGFERPPESGSQWEVYSTVKEAKRVAEARQKEEAQKANQVRGFAGDGSGDDVKLAVILKTDSMGSLAAVKYMFQDVDSKYVNLRWVLATPGIITEADVDLALACPEDQQLMIVGFNTTASPGAERLAREKGVTIRTFDIIYKLFETVVAKLEGDLDEEEKLTERGWATVLATFKGREGKVAGGRVEEGMMIKNGKAVIFREGKEIGSGPIVSLREVKSEVKEVDEGNECGWDVKGFHEWEAGDTVKCYEVQLVTPDIVKK